MYCEFDALLMGFIDENNKKEKSRIHKKKKEKSRIHQKN